MNLYLYYMYYNKFYSQTTKYNPLFSRIKKKNIFIKQLEVDKLLFYFILSISINYIL